MSPASSKGLLFAGSWIFYAAVGFVTGSALGLILILSTLLALGTVLMIHFFESRVALAISREPANKEGERERRE